MAGTAPVSYDSGKLHQVHLSWACDKFLRHTVHLWANCFRQASAWGQAYYRQKRQQGMNHSCALRCLAQRLLKILCRMLQDRKPYDAEVTHPAIYGGKKVILTNHGKDCAEIVRIPQVDREAALDALRAIGPVGLPPRK